MFIVSVRGVFSVRTTAAPITIAVNSTADGTDAVAGDAACQTLTPGECTLRAAIEGANANVGADTIQFAISGNGVPVIAPVISEQATIDGYTHWHGY